MQCTEKSTEKGKIIHNITSQRQLLAILCFPVTYISTCVPLPISFTKCHVHFSKPDYSCSFFIAAQDLDWEVPSTGARWQSGLEKGEWAGELEYSTSKAGFCFGLPLRVDLRVLELHHGRISFLYLAWSQAGLADVLEKNTGLRQTQSLDPSRCMTTTCAIKQNCRPTNLANSY